MSRWGLECARRPLGNGGNSNSKHAQRPPEQPWRKIRTAVPLSSEQLPRLRHPRQRRHCCELGIGTVLLQPKGDGGATNKNTSTLTEQPKWHRVARPRVSHPDESHTCAILDTGSSSELGAQASMHAGNGVSLPRHIPTNAHEHCLGSGRAAASSERDFDAHGTQHDFFKLVIRPSIPKDTPISSGGAHTCAMYWIHRFGLLLGRGIARTATVTAAYNQRHYAPHQSVLSEQTVLATFASLLEELIPEPFSTNGSVSC